MPAQHLVRRIPYRQITEQLWPAFEAAREQGSLEPLRPFLDVDRLDPQAHILTGRRYLLFGPEQRSLIGVRSLVVQALDRLAAETLDLGPAVPRVASILRRRGDRPEELRRWESLFDWDHNLPRWMRGQHGPSLASPEEATALREGLDDVRALAVELDERLGDPLRALGELLDRRGTDEGLAITARAPDGSSPVCE
jgi:hypothetical protein